MRRAVAIVFSILGLLATLVAASTAAAGLAALGGGLAGVFVFAGLLIVAGVSWLLSVVFFVAAFVGTRGLRSTVIAVLMWAAAVVSFLAGFTAFGLSFADGALSPLGQLYAASVAVALVVWGSLLTVMGLRRR